MGASVFYEGSAEFATLTNTFQVNSVATDPTTISLAVTTPAGTTTTYTYAAAEITRTGTGVYTKDIACSEDGTWMAVWTGTGTASDVVVSTWKVSPTEHQKLYCTPEELKSSTGIDDTLDDFEILAACTAVSRRIDEWCMRHFWRGTSTRTFATCDSYRLDIDDLVSVVTLKTDTGGDGTFETTWATTDYQLLPVNATTAHAESKPYTSIKAVGSYTFPRGGYRLDRDDRTEIAGVWGWPVIPAAVREAAAIMAVDLTKLGGMAFGAQGYAEYGPVRARVNPIAADLLAPYRKHAVLVG